MKRAMLISVAAMTVAACSQPGPGQGTAGAGGSTGTGGSNAGTGGSNSATGGSNASTGGSSAGSGGSNVGTGGNNSATGGSNAGTGGSNSATGGSNAGTGGTAGTGGAAGNTLDAGGGNADAAAPDAGQGSLNIGDIVPGLDGYYWEVAPSGNMALSGTNYPFGPVAGGCPNQTSPWDIKGYVNTAPVLNVRGTTGQRYTINVGVRGVVGTRCYTGGTPATTAAGNPSGQNNTWYAGGAQFNDSVWNTMEIRVAPKVPGQPTQGNSAYDIYFANSFNTSAWCEKEATYEARYNASFPVIGGGTITFVVHDSNCRTLGNCGAVENQVACDTAAARRIDMSGLSPAPVNFTQPRTGALAGATYNLQWVWIDVTSVTSP